MKIAAAAAGGAFWTLVLVGAFLGVWAGVVAGVLVAGAVVAEESARKRS